MLTAHALVGQNAYIANSGSNNISVIATRTDTVIATILVGTRPSGVAVTLDGSKVYVANLLGNNISVISTGTNSVVATIPAPGSPTGVGVTPDGSKLYVPNGPRNNVLVISTATNTVTGTVPVGISPIAIGLFIGPAAGGSGAPGTGGAAAIPTLSGWALLLLTMSLALLGAKRLASARR